MTLRSIYCRGGNGMTTGGIDGYLGPEAQNFSNLPTHIDEVDPDEDVAVVDCQGKDSKEAVCQIAAAEQEKTVAETKSKNTPQIWHNRRSKRGHFPF
jgi:hypothetical protein